MTNPEARQRAIGFIHRGYSEADQALDKFAAGKDNQGLILAVQAAQSLESGLRIFRNILVDICEHGVPAGDWCEPCNLAYKEAAKQDEET